MNDQRSDNSENNDLERLNKTRDQYAFLFNFAPVGYFTFNRNGEINFVNVTGANLLSHARHELVGRRFEHFIDDKDRLKFSHFIKTVFNRHEKKTCRLDLASFLPTPLSVRIEALANSSCDEIHAVLIDITEKKRAEQALYESEYNLAKAQAMTHVGSWSYDPITTEVRASAELLRILRLKPEQVTQEMFAAVVHPDDHDMVIERLHNTIEHGKAYEIEHRLLFSDGEQKWVYTIVEPAVNNAGKVLKLYGSTQDITQRKKSEVELRNKTNELLAIFDSIGDGIIVYDNNARIQHHNLISPQLFPEKVFPGAPCNNIFHLQENRSPQDCPVEKALQGERVDTSLIINLNNSQQRARYIDVTATPIRDSMGEQNRALVFLRDVSTKRLQEMHLIQAEKMSSVGMLATGVAHEINNPLTSVAGCAEALLRRFREAPELLEFAQLEQFPHYLEIILRESYRCKGIIDHLLSFGSMSDGLRRKVDINLALKEVIELLKYQDKYQQIQVSTDLLTELPRVEGDPSALRQVFMNLLVNAHQAIKGRGDIFVSTRKQNSRHVQIVIRDTGDGMEQNILDRIWEPFFTTKEAGKGLGLGLALTYNIVKDHKGEITIESSPGQGSVFTLLLPISADNANPTTAKARY
ncbi:PAS domain-containing sensor histidine kinase [Desulfuromonas thiophila]|uniref:histidine kinase n=1 Tax=Desulfuromonas thiophila TaxID=57664 RepID=A0A1G7F4I2_9BACT|nr:PAS domain-containing sensor histidine kinase [Desulfuromonas thiophila]SDE70762.1 PAS domain S-box-containing protein [Desulfuromonas thiophila]